MDGLHRAADHRGDCVGTQGAGRDVVLLELPFGGQRLHRVGAGDAVDLQAVRLLEGANGSTRRDPEHAVDGAGVEAVSLQLLLQLADGGAGHARPFEKEIGHLREHGFQFLQLRVPRGARFVQCRDALLRGGFLVLDPPWRPPQGLR